MQSIAAMVIALSILALFWLLGRKAKRDLEDVDRRMSDVRRTSRALIKKLREEKSDD